MYKRMLLAQKYTYGHAGPRVRLVLSAGSLRPHFFDRKVKIDQKRTLLSSDSTRRGLNYPRGSNRKAKDQYRHTRLVNAN